jgi:hypothetical protein
MVMTLFSINVGHLSLSVSLLGSLLFQYLWGSNHFRTPLLAACYHGHAECVRLLLRHLDHEHLAAVDEVDESDISKKRSMIAVWRWQCDCSACDDQLSVKIQ